MRYIIPWLIIIPALELSLLLFSGKTIGILPTVVLILATGFLGAYLAKKQGMQTVARLKEEMRDGHFIGDAVLDGVCILIGGLLLLTPGFVTDAFGFLLLLPFTRRYFKPFLYKLFKRLFDSGSKIIVMK
ncbi:FxsA family protein [Bacillus xiapuensis]|uniref:FxsA family protein n=1 Tax=Bacillus xiapuensis TaxID=2014075 RepID=UPI000C23CF52|nr:FxsA family protein [Bacillus xiapuensis]